MNIRNALTRARNWIAGVLLSLAGLLGIITMPPADSAGATVQDVLSWTMPTHNTDGTPLLLTDIAATNIAWGSASGGPYPNTQDVPAPATTLTLVRSGDGTGTRCYRAAVTTTAATNSVQSQWTPEVCKTVRAPPNPPSDVIVK